MTCSRGGGGRIILMFFLIIYASVLQEEKHGEPDCLYKNVHIEVKSHDPMVLKSYQKFVTMTARELDVNIVKMWVWIE